MSLPFLSLQMIAIGLTVEDISFVYGLLPVLSIGGIAAIGKMSVSAKTSHSLKRLRNKERCQYCSIDTSPFCFAPFLMNVSIIHITHVWLLLLKEIVSIWEKQSDGHELHLRQA